MFALNNNTDNTVELSCYPHHYWKLIYSSGFGGLQTNNIGSWKHGIGAKPGHWMKHLKCIVSDEIYIVYLDIQ